MVAAIAAVCLVLTLTACGSGGKKKVQLVATKAYSDATAIAHILHKHKAACGEAQPVSTPPAGVASEVSCPKSRYGPLFVFVFSGATVPQSWVQSYQHLCPATSGTKYIRGKNWAIAPDSSVSNDAMDKLGLKVKITPTSFC
jgi:hypothetical protein